MRALLRPGVNAGRRAPIVGPIALSWRRGPCGGLPRARVRARRLWRRGARRRFRQRGDGCVGQRRRGRRWRWSRGLRAGGGRGRAGRSGDVSSAGVYECAEGFVLEADAGCRAELPARACGSGTMALPGEAACRDVAACGPAPWGDVVTDADTRDRAHLRGRHQPRRRRSLLGEHGRPRHARAEGRGGCSSTAAPAPAISPSTTDSPLRTA